MNMRCQFTSIGPGASNRRQGDGSGDDGVLKGRAFKRGDRRAPPTMMDVWRAGCRVVAGYARFKAAVLAASAHLGRHNCPDVTGYGRLCPLMVTCDYLSVCSWIGACAGQYQEEDTLKRGLQTRDMLKHGLQLGSCGRSTMQRGASPLLRREPGCPAWRRLCSGWLRSGSGGCFAWHRLAPPGPAASG